MSATRSNTGQKRSWRRFARNARSSASRPAWCRRASAPPSSTHSASAPRRKCSRRWRAPARHRIPTPIPCSSSCTELRRCNRFPAERCMEQSFIEILRRALDEELARDASVYLLGEDVAAGGAFGVTRGLAQKHGEKRVRNTPISEAAITGLATGAALCGLKPVLEVMFIDFATLAMDCLVNQTAKYRYMSGGQLTVPLVVRTQSGAAGGAAAQHSQSLEAWFVHVPGLIVVAPATPAEAYGLLKSAIRLGEPVLFIEHKRLYTMRAALDAGAPLPPIGEARVAREGTDVTLIAYSAMVQTALAAADELADRGVSVEVIDLRTLLPLDMATIARSVSKTHRVVIAHEAVLNGGFGAEIAARIGMELFDELDAPVWRVGCPFAPIPFAPELERALLPGSETIVSAVEDMLGAQLPAPG